MCRATPGRQNSSPKPPGPGTNDSARIKQQSRKMQNGRRHELAQQNVPMEGRGASCPLVIAR